MIRRITWAADLRAWCLAAVILAVAISCGQAENQANTELRGGRNGTASSPPAFTQTSPPQRFIATSPPPASTLASPPSTAHLLPCDPAAADYQKQGMPTPGPCISIDPEQQIRDNLRHLQRMNPKPADAAALQPARADLDRTFQELRAQGLYDDTSVRTAIARYRSLNGALVHPPGNEKRVTVDARAMVWLEHGSACLIGEHGPTRSIVEVVGHTLDGGCEALYGH